MGQIKAKKTSSKKSIVSKVAKTAKSAISSLSAKRSTGKRRGRMTPERLAKKILVERLKKKLYKLKYGGR